jgi:hypothetical protein
MKRRLVKTAAIVRSWPTMRLIGGVLIASSVGGCAPHRSTSAIVVRIHPGPDVSEVLRVQDPTAMRRLESRFPRYWMRPGSMWGGGWIAGYDVYIDDNSGRTVHIMVSHDVDGSQFWTVGKGDFEVAGDFEKFVKAIEVKCAR